MTTIARKLYQRNSARQRRADPISGAIIKERERVSRATNRLDPIWRTENNRKAREWYHNRSPEVRAKIIVRNNAQARLRRTGVTAEQWDKRFEQCGGKCELCGRTSEPGSGYALGADHDHDTMAFRGILCTGCNSGIGHLGDNVEGLERALAYLRKAIL